MLTEKEWHDLLYDLGLFGQDWAYVDRLRDAYLSWRLTGERTDRFGTDEWGPITEEKLEELISKANLPEVHQRLIVNVLHHVACPEDFPLPRLPKIN